MIYRTAELISSAISLPLVIATFIAALLGTFTSWALSFFFLERVWEKIVKPGNIRSLGKDAMPHYDLAGLVETAGNGR